jgi:hypothetical protein
MASAIIIQYGPLDSTNPGSAGIPIEAFDAYGSLGGRCNKIVETVANAGSSSPRPPICHRSQSQILRDGQLEGQHEHNARGLLRGQQ